MIRAQVDTTDQAEALLSLRSSYDFWSEIGVGRTVDIRVSPDQVGPLTNVLELADMAHSVMVHDVQSLVDMTKMVPVSKETRVKQGHSMDWTQYHPIEDMHSYLTYLQVFSAIASFTSLRGTKCQTGLQIFYLLGHL